MRANEPRCAISWSADCNSYLGKRVGTYEFRCRRYKAVFDEMVIAGFNPDSTVVDVGAGRCEFGLYIRERMPHSRHAYIPIDGAIDGVDLETWEPHLLADYYVAIEVLEHLANPGRLFRAMQRRAARGVILTTPNPETTDVLGMDETHKTPIGYGMLWAWGCAVKALPLFTRSNDTLIGTYVAE